MLDSNDLALHPAKLWNLSLHPANLWNTVQITAATASELCQLFQCPGCICYALTTDTRTTDVLRHIFVHPAKRLPNISPLIRKRVSKLYRIRFQ
jgi:hypothetical protein